MSLLIKLYRTQNHECVHVSMSPLKKKEIYPTTIKDPIIFPKQDPFLGQVPQDEH